LLTRDRGLLKRSIVTHGIYLHSDQPDEQLKEVVGRLDLDEMLRPFSRCGLCNGLLQSVPKETVEDDVPARTFQYVHEYYRCDQCGKVFWKGTHWPRLKQIIRIATQHAAGTRPGNADRP
jgi:uncharacterized protein with PIN domain